jgi:hypothetical protein
VTDRETAHATRRNANPKFAEYPYTHYKDLKVYKPQRYMCIINHPSVDNTTDTRTVRVGFYCRGCNEWSKKNELAGTTEDNKKLEESDREKKCQKLYTEAYYLEHLIHCEGSLELMRSGEIIQLI